MNKPNIDGPDLYQFLLVAGWHLSVPDLACWRVKLYVGSFDLAYINDLLMVNYEVCNLFADQKVVMIMS